MTNPRGAGRAPGAGLTAGLAVALLAGVAGGCGPGGDDGARTRGGGEAGGAASRSESPAYRVPETPAGSLLARSVAFHDPGGWWRSRPLEVRWESSRPGGERRVAEIRVDNPSGAFDLEMEFRGHALEIHVAGDSVRTRVDGSAEVPADTRERLRLHREDGLYWRNYFLFLLGMPMKLTDPGADLAGEVRTVEFEGRPLRAIRARYRTEDGYPWWEFYFDPADARLRGARFWREGPDADGEYIVMEGLAEAGPLRLPAVRRWYTNAEGEHLGTDEVARLDAGQR